MALLCRVCRALSAATQPATDKAQQRYAHTHAASSATSFAMADTSSGTITTLATAQPMARSSLRGLGGGWGPAAFG